MDFGMGGCYPEQLDAFKSLDRDPPVVCPTQLTWSDCGRNVS